MFSVLVNIPFLYAIFMGVASACSRKAVTVGSLTENRKLAGFQEPGLVSLLSKIEHTPCFLFLPAVSLSRALLRRSLLVCFSPVASSHPGRLRGACAPWCWEPSW